MAETAQIVPLLRPEEGVRRVAVLGAFRVSDGRGQDLTPKGRKTRALLAYVLLASGPVTRDRLAALLWGDRGEEQAKASLRQALYELRDLTSGPVPVITVARDDAAANPAAFELDLDVLADAAQEGDLACVAAALDRSDALLADLDGASPEFDDWLAVERTRRGDRLTVQALQAGRVALDAGRAAQAQQLADALERTDPLNEPAVRLGLMADREAGDLAALHRRFRRFGERLKAELGAAPAAETQALFEALTAPGAAAPPRLPGAADVPARVIGRSWLLGLLAAAGLAIAATLLILAWPRIAPPPSSPSLAVLPFRTAGQDYFGAGVSEAILDVVARDPKVKVVGAASSRAVAAGANPLATARRVGVNYVLAGEAQERAGRVTIAARLLGAKDGRTVWSARFNRPVDDVFAVQSEIAAAVAEHLGARIAPTADPHRVTRPEVYDRYLQALGLQRQRRASTLAEARRLLLEAVALDPNYSPAYASLSEVTSLLSDHPTSYGDIPMEKAAAEARTYARRALELSPGLGEAYAAYGLISFSDAESVPFYERAVALDPQRADFHRWLGNAYQAVGRQRDALREIQRAAALEPVWSLCAEHLVGQLTAMGRMDEARAVIDRFVRVSEDPDAVAQVRLAMTGADGQLAQYATLSQALLRRAPSDHNRQNEAAKAWALLGENDRALRLLPSNARVARLALSGDAAGLAALAEARGRAFWDMEPGHWGLADALLRAGRGRVLVQLYDDVRATGDDPFERNPDLLNQVGTDLVLALQQAGRRADADSLAARVLDRLDAQERDGLWPPNVAYTRAAILTALGRRDAAIAQLKLQLDKQWTNLAGIPHTRLAQRPEFQSLVGDARFAAIDAGLVARLNGQRALAGLPPLKN